MGFFSNCMLLLACVCSLTTSHRENCHLLKPLINRIRLFRCDNRGAINSGESKTVCTLHLIIVKRNFKSKHKWELLSLCASGFCAGHTSPETFYQQLLPQAREGCEIQQMCPIWERRRPDESQRTRIKDLLVLIKQRQIDLHILS